mmetsp:Transcript_62877/g.72156  ORF Transcript_62877/g.72156 Transcript_62877/m.72156 type:complete len:106 (+) Transcript_62877:2100-2417(+)
MTNWIFEYDLAEWELRQLLDFIFSLIFEPAAIFSSLLSPIQINQNAYHKSAKTEKEVQLQSVHRVSHSFFSLFQNPEITPRREDVRRKSRNILPQFALVSLPLVF